MQSYSHTSQSWWLLLLAALALSIRASQYVDGNPEYFESFLLDHYRDYLPTVALHAIVGILTLSLGPLLLHSGLRTRFPVAHRVLGYVYAFAVLIGGGSGLFMGRRAFGGPLARFSFSLLAVLWVFTVCIGVAFAIRRDFKRHRRWMIRNYALTFSALSFRVMLTLFQKLGFPFDDSYDLAALLGWTLTLGMAELALRYYTTEPRASIEQVQITLLPCTILTRELCSTSTPSEPLFSGRSSSL